MENEPKKKMGCLKIVGIIVGVFIVLGVIGALMGPESSGSGAATNAADSTGKGDAKADPKDQAVKVTAQELFKAYESNEAAAQQTYGGKSLLVSGTIDKITLDFMDKPVVMLRTPNQFMSAQASLTEASQTKATSLGKGQKIELLCGGVSEVAGTPMLSDCEIQ